MKIKEKKRRGGVEKVGEGMGGNNGDGKGEEGGEEKSGEGWGR